MDLWQTAFCFVKKPFARHCEQSEAIQKNWIATPLIAVRDDEIDG